MRTTFIITVIVISLLIVSVLLRARRRAGAPPPPPPARLAPVVTTASNPVLPFCLLFKDGFPPFSHLSVRGSVPTGVTSIDGTTNKFVINLELDPANIALHFKVMSNDAGNYVIYNSKHNDVWKTQQYRMGSSRHRLFETGKPFTVEIFSEPTCFVILINGFFGMRYPHTTIAPSSIRKLTVTSNVVTLSGVTMRRLECVT